MVIEFRTRDVLKLKMVHPCGRCEWSVVRFGADISLKYQHCALNSRVESERQFKASVLRGI